MTTYTYNNVTRTTTIVVNDGDEADLNNATVTSGSNSNGVLGLGTVTVKLVGSTIIATNRGITDDAPGTLTVSADSNSSITGSDGVGSGSAVIALVNAGQIQANSSGGNGIFLGQSGSTIVNSGTISGGPGAYAINASSAATITNSGTITAGTAGALRFETGGGALNLSNGATPGVITGAIVDNGPLTLSTNGLAMYDLTSPVTGSGSLQVVGGGSLSLSATNTYTGGTTVTGGATTLVLNHTTATMGGTIDAAGTGAITLSDGRLTLGTGGTLANGLVTAGTGGPFIQAQASVTLTGAISGSLPSGELSFSAASGTTVTFASGANTYAGIVDLSGAGGFTAAVANVFNANDTLQNIAPFGGTGTALTLQADQTVGALQGDLVITGAPATGTVALTVGALNFSTTQAGQISGALSLTKVGTGVLTLTGADTYTGGTTIGAGVLRIGNGGATGSITGNVVDNATLQFSRSDNGNLFAGVISGAGAVVVDSGGVQSLSGANTYTGGTTVNGASVTDGHLTNGVHDGLGTGAVTLNNGSLLIGGGTLVNNIVINGAGTIGNGVFTLNDTISGAGTLTYNASGLTLAATMTDVRTAGATVINAFTAITANAPATLLSTSDFIVARSASLTLASAAAYRVASLADGSAQGMAAAIVQAAAAGVTTLSVGGGASASFSGVLQNGAGLLALTKTGASTQTLTGANTYTGATTVAGGVLAVDGSLTSAITVANGATLRGVGTDTAGVTVQAGGAFAPGEGTGTFTAGALTLSAGSTFAETIAGANALGKAQVGSATLGGALTLNYTGGAEATGTAYTVLQGLVTGGFTNSTVTSNGHTFAITVGATSVVLTDVTGPPTITGTRAGQPVADNATVRPFASAQVGDATGGTDTVTITVTAGGVASDADGALSGTGLTKTGVGTYTLAAGAAGAVTTSLEALTFTPTPNQVAPGATVTTGFTVTAANGVGSSAPDGVTTVVATSVDDAPALGGSGAASATTDKATATPLSAIILSDPDTNDVETATVSFTAANGTFAGLGAATTANGSASYTVSGSASAVQAALRGAVFTPTANQAAPGQSVTTTFTVADRDAGGLTAQPATATLTTSSVNDPPTVAGTHSSSVGDRASDALFSGVTVGDPDTGQTQTATLSFAATDGVLTGAGAATVANGAATYTVSAGSASALTTALQAVGFTPTQAPAGSPATTTAVSLTVSDGAASTATDTGTVVTATHTTNTPVAVANAAPAQAITDKATAQPFAGVTVTDPDTGQTETATLTYAAADGVLSGAGLTGSAGAYGLSAGSAAALQAALRQLVFTPTADEVSPGQTVRTSFGVAVSDGSSTARTSDVVTTTSVNDAPTIGGVPAQAALPAAGSATLAPALTISDPDPGATVVGAQVAIGAGFIAGDRLSATPAAGIAAVYDAATGVLTLTGPASDTAYAQVLRSVTISHDGPVDAGARQVSVSVTDDQGGVAQAGETVTVEGYDGPGRGGFGGGGSTTPTNLDAQQRFAIQLDNLTRASANDPAFSTPTSPLFTAAQAEAAIAGQLNTGRIALADAQNALYHLVDGTTSVAEISYAFFTGRTPTAAGLNYLVHSDADATDLNDPYYAQFSTENRYINFADNLATGAGAGAAAFQAAYGPLSLSDATAKAYAAVFGFAPAAGRIDAILNSQVSDGRGGTETRAQYFADITGGSAAAQKAAAIGFLLADSVKEGFGAYQQADLHFLADLAHGTAVFNVDLLAAYGQAPTLVGLAITDATLGG